MDFKKIIDLFYPEENILKHILLTHSQSVTHTALQIVSCHPELKIDARFVQEAAMLHDIGIIRCAAPSISCYGKEPYICHGRIGAEMLRGLGYDKHARVCERHTGAGLTKDDISSQHLPLPAIDLLPETIEEKLICYADKFHSKTHLNKIKTYEQAESSLAKFGEGSVKRFRELRELFG